MTSTGARSHMSLALAEARAAAARGEVPVGAVIVSPAGVVLAAAGNRTRELRDPTAHAEMLAIRIACAELADERLDRLRSLRDARALPDVRGGDLVRSRQAPLLRGQRSEGRRHRAGRARFQPADVPSRAGSLRWHAEAEAWRYCSKLLCRAPRSVTMSSRRKPRMTIGEKRTRFLKIVFWSRLLPSPRKRGEGEEE